MWCAVGFVVGVFGDEGGLTLVAQRFECIETWDVVVAVLGGERIEFQHLLLCVISQPV